MVGVGGVGLILFVWDDGLSLEIEIFYLDDVVGGCLCYEIVS